MDSSVAATESVFDFRSTEFLLVALGVVMTIAVLVAGIWLFRAASREHRVQLERERREREKQSQEKQSQEKQSQEEQSQSESQP